MLGISNWLWEWPMDKRDINQDSHVYRKRRVWPGFSGLSADLSLSGSGLDCQRWKVKSSGGSIHDLDAQQQKRGSGLVLAGAG